jgi:hypothetical protein
MKSGYILSSQKSTNKKTKIPDNITLIQYKLSTNSLAIIDVLHIINHINKNTSEIEPFFKKNKSTNEIYQNDGTIYANASSTIIDDLKLTFTTNLMIESFNKSLKSQVVDVDGKVYLNSTVNPKQLLLSQLLSDLSMRYKKLYPGKKIIVYQLSCKDRQKNNGTKKLIQKYKELSQNQKYPRNSKIIDLYFKQFPTKKNFIGFSNWLDQNFNDFRLNKSIHYIQTKRKGGATKKRKFSSSERVILPVVKKVTEEDINNLNFESGYILSHGGTYDGQAKVPDNITLITYTDSNKALGPIDVHYIVSNMLENNLILQPPWLQDIENKTIYQPDGHFTQDDPGNVIQDILLTFNDEQLQYGQIFTQCIYLPDGKINVPENKTEYLLSKLLKDISEYQYRNHGVKKIILVQLSCRYHGLFTHHGSEIRRFSDIKKISQMPLIPRTAKIEAPLSIGLEFINYVKKRFVQVRPKGNIDYGFLDEFNPLWIINRNNVSESTLRYMIKELFGKEGNIVCKTTSSNDNVVTVECHLEHDILKGQCFKMKVDDDKMSISHLKFPDEFNCKIKGGEILYKLYRLASKLGLTTIELDDYSNLYFNNHTQHIDFAIYRILLTGESWYNKYCYKSVHHDENKRHNEIVRKSIIGTANNIEYWNLSEQVKKLTVEEYAICFSKLPDPVGSDNVDPGSIEAFNTFVRHLYNEMRYTRALTLSVNDTKTKAFYEKWPPFVFNHQIPFVFV